MKRRRYLAAVSTVGVGVLAGCVGDDGTGGGDDTADETDEEATDDETDDGGEADNDEADTPDSEETDTPDDEGEADGGDDEPDEDGGDAEHEALAVFDAYVEAAEEEDLDGLATYMHSHHPFNPDNLDDDEREDVFTFEPADIDGYERELVDEAFDTDDVRDVPGIEFWFAESDVTLDEILDGEEAVLVETTHETSEDDEAVEETEQLILLTEGDDWRVFFPYEEPSDVPEGEPVDDEEYRIVDRIEYDTETEVATIHVSDTGDIEAEELVAYSASLQQDSSVWSEDADTLPNTNFFTVGFDPDGDEIVVTIRFEDDETVIYRETYEPDE